MERIFIDFNGAKREADAIEELAFQMRSSVAVGFKDRMEEVAGSWKGENASAFLQKGEKMQERLYQTAEDIETVAECIRRTARALYEAEKKAEEIARTVSAKE